MRTQRLFSTLLGISIIMCYILIGINSEHVEVSEKPGHYRRRNPVPQTTFKKCCLPNEEVLAGRQDSLFECISTDENRQQELENATGASFSNVGFPNCEFRVLSNEKVRWWRARAQIEVGLQYLLYPVWLPVTEHYCVDYVRNYNSDAETTTEIIEVNKTINNSQKLRNTIIAFCDLQGLPDYYEKSELILLFLISSAVFNSGTLTIYLVVRKTLNSRGWLQFSVFLAELLGNISYSLLLILHVYIYLWDNSFGYLVFFLYSFVYLYTVKFALVIAASVDLLWCVWKPFTTLNEKERSNKNKTAILICCIFPLFVPIVTNTMAFFNSTNELNGIYRDSTHKLAVALPKYYKIITRSIFFLELVINVSFAILASILIKRQRSKTKTAREILAHTNLHNSFVMYIKLICSTEIPFSINFVLLTWLSEGHPLSLWWNLTRSTFLFSSMYTFIFFGLTKQHKKQIKKMYVSSISTSGY